MERDTQHTGHYKCAMLKYFIFAYPKNEHARDHLKG